MSTKEEGYEITKMLLKEKMGLGGLETIYFNRRLKKAIEELNELGVRAKQRRVKFKRI